MVQGEGELSGRGCGRVWTEIEKMTRVIERGDICIWAKSQWATLPLSLVLSRGYGGCLPLVDIVNGMV